MQESKWIVKSRAFWAMLAPLVAWGLAEFGAPEGTPDFVKRIVEWGFAGAGIIFYGFHLFKPDNANVTISPASE